MNINKLTKKKRLKITPTGWGSEIEIHNGDGYCGRILNLKEDEKSSLHYHINKQETFYVLSGKVLMDISFDLRSESFVLSTGDAIDIPRYVMHRFKGITDAVVLEVSTEDAGEDDIIRVEEGATQNKKLWKCGNKEFLKWESKVNRILGK